MQIDWWSLGFQTINFLIVVWLLSRFLYRPVRRIIDAREAKDRKLSEEAQAKADAADRARQDYGRKLAELADAQRRQEAELQSTMQKKRDATLKAAREKADALLSDTREKLERDREETLKALKAEIGTLAADLARTALASGVAQDAALRQARDCLEDMPSRDLDDLRKDVAEAATAATVVTAVPLGDEARSSWRSLLSERLGTEGRIDFAEDPEILGGAELHFPHAVLKLSVAQRLKDAAAEITA